jgi:AcrR family transcriptional regulator
MPKIVDRSSEHPPLDRRAIARAAFTLIDREGLPSLTMRRLGRELGVEAMSIYHHVPNKAALLEMIVDGALESADIGFVGSSPVELIEQYCRALREALLRHREVAPLAAQRLASPSYRSAPLESAHRELIRAGFDDQAAGWIVSAFVNYVAGHALVELTDPGRASGDAAFETGLRFLLGGLRDELEL